jgi:hypothetical protein
MTKSIYFSIFLLVFGITFAQQTSVSGIVVDSTNESPIPEVTVTIEGSLLSANTNVNGKFEISGTELPLGEQILVVKKEGFITKSYPIVLTEGENLDLETLFLKVDISEETEQIGIISLSDNELAGDDSVLFNVSGLLQSTRDVFLRAAAFDFSATFFNPRGYDNARGKVLINGLEMNKFDTGRPQWTQWGGLNDIQRNRTLSMNTHANEYQFGDLAGTTNIDMRASGQRKGGRVSYASSNRSYEGRVMGSYNSGVLAGGWSYSVLISRRFGDEGFQDATLYDANSFSASVEKQINDKHSVNFTGFYAQNRRGLSNAITDEVEQLKGRRYNPEWGFQNGEKRNVRERSIDQPVFMLNHYWDINDNISLNTNVGYQFGTIGTTRVDNGGTRLAQGPNGENYYIGGALNPSPVYWQRLPSFFLQDENPTSTDYANAFLAQQEFLRDGQFNWNDAYQANITNSENGGNSTYIVKEDLVDDDMFSFNTILNAKLSERITLNASIDYRSLYSENYAEVVDLLGGQQFLDVDFFADEDSQAIGDAVDIAQSDIRNPNRLVVEGDRYEYNYEIDVQEYNAFAQTQFQYDWVDFYVGANFGQTTYQRTGIYENGYYPGELSFGKGEKLEFDNIAAKIGGVFKVEGGHYIDVNAAHIQQAPTLRNSYVNPRQNGITVDGITEVISNSADISYIYRSPIIQARLTAYYTKITDQTNTGFYFTEDITGFNPDNASAFVQEVMTGIDLQHLGAELGIEAQVTPTIKLKAAGAFGQHTYDSNPNLYLQSQDFGVQQVTFGDGKTALKNLRVPGGPQQAYQIGFEYRDPNYWNFGLTSNYYSNAYVSPSGLVRSENFRLDLDGQEFADFDPDVARQTLKQEQFDDYFLFNAIGGKSWKVDDYYIGFFAVVNNIFGEEYKQGGFEQSRRSNFQNRTEDLNRANGPLFGNRYFFGRGTTYYLNLYVRF